MVRSKNSLDGLSRRAFLQGAGSAVLVLSLAQLRCRPASQDSVSLAEGAAEAATPPRYEGWQDVYRAKWTWDRVAKGTHYVNCWYQRGCNWNVFVKDGIVFREEQVADYPQTNSNVPDFNPRGCQKGACYSQRMYDASRLRHPLRRVGPRGSRSWRRASWDEALDEIADRVIDALGRDGPGSIIWDFGTGATNGCHGLGLYRTCHVLDTPMLDMNAEIGDHHPGAAATLGKISFASSADDLFYSTLILVWGGNPVYTQIPNAHFTNEARYHGARVVVITPDYNASAVHADEWIPVEIGSDAALGLSLAHVMIEEAIHDVRFIVEQTDLPLLVRRDTRRLLRARDLESGGDEVTFYLFDRRTGGLQKAPRTTLALGDLEPALEGHFRVQTLQGEVEVSPAFELLRERLRDYAPEATQTTTGVDPDTVRRLAREIATTRAATILTQTNFSKFYHGLEMERAQILVCALSGQIGRKGSGPVGFPFLSIAGVDALNVASGNLPPKLGMAWLGVKSAPELARLKWQGHTTESMLYEMARAEYRGGGFLPAALFFFLEGGLDEIYGRSKEWDPHLKRELREYLDESLSRGWQIAPQTRPRIFFEVGGNVLRRVRGYDRLIEKFLPKLDLLVTFDWRMSNTALHSDWVLPAAGWYEKDDITWATPISPFAHATTRAVEPVAESWTDWEFHCRLVRRIQERAIARGIRTFRDRHGEERRLDRVYDEMTFGRRFTEENAEELLDELLSIASNLGGMRWEEFKERGYARYTEIGMSFANIGNATDIAPDDTITANTWHVEKKLPWPTVTRRIQFYIDSGFFLELGEELPVHKDDPPIGGDYPLRMTGGHTRWSIHAAWRDERHMLQLQRGEPIVYVSPVDAGTRGIADGERVRLRNDIGAFEIQAKVSPAVRPGQVIVYHAWEPFQFTAGKSQQTLTPSPINPIQLSGGDHLQPMMIVGEPGLHDRGTRVEMERIESRRS
jgi:DMSO reductase family type II enzyme molybdopterin subunit